MAKVTFELVRTMENLFRDEWENLLPQDKFDYYLE